jgi:hypothetical protein
MSDPTRLPEKEQSLQAQTEEINRLERMLAQHGQAAQSLAEVEEPAVSEKLFSRRTLFGWAFATLLVVFVIRMVLPVVFQTVKESVISSMKESVGSTTVTPVVAPAPPTTVIPAPAVPATPSEPAATTAPAAKPGATVKVEVKKR